MKWFSIVFSFIYIWTLTTEPELTDYLIKIIESALIIKLLWMVEISLFKSLKLQYLTRLTANKPPSAPAAPVVVVVAAPAKVEQSIQQSIQKMDPQSDDEDSDRAGGQGDIQPVGHDYVEEVSEKCVEIMYCMCV